MGCQSCPWESEQCHFAHLGHSVQNHIFASFLRGWSQLLPCCFSRLNKKTWTMKWTCMDHWSRKECMRLYFSQLRSIMWNTRMLHFKDVCGRLNVWGSVYFFKCSKIIWIERLAYYSTYIVLGLERSFNVDKRMQKAEQQPEGKYIPMMVLTNSSLERCAVGKKLVRSSIVLCRCYRMCLVGPGVLCFPFVLCWERLKSSCFLLAVYFTESL